jgi:hypothetical protein
MGLPSPNELRRGELARARCDLDDYLGEYLLIHRHFEEEP